MIYVPWKGRIKECDSSMGKWTWMWNMKWTFWGRNWTYLTYLSFWISEMGEAWRWRYVSQWGYARGVNRALWLVSLGNYIRWVDQTPEVSKSTSTNETQASIAIPNNRAFPLSQEYLIRVPFFDIGSRGSNSWGSRFAVVIGRTSFLNVYDLS